MTSKQYHEWLQKFETKKTTDDCYTPPEVYDVVLDYVKQHCDIEGKRIVRPFYPGGDYENEDYTDAVVVDNPPFSIFTQIIDFYNKEGIPFFLFANHLTIFSSVNSRENTTAIIIDYAVEFSNGAKVNTGFVTNMMPGIRVVLDREFGEDIKSAQKNVGGGEKTTGIHIPSQYH